MIWTNFNTNNRHAANKFQCQLKIVVYSEKTQYQERGFLGPTA